MTIKISTAVRNLLAGAGSIKTTMDGGSEIRIFGGTVPLNADDATTGATLIVTIRNGISGILFDSAPVAGVLPKKPSETWSGVCVATGTPTFYRHVLTGDTNNASTTAPRYQGSVGVVGADMNLTSSSLVSGATQTLDYHAIAIPSE